MTAPPSGPPQRVFTLSFPGLRWCLDANGDIDLVNPAWEKVNAGALDAFYQRHQLHKSFVYESPQFGPLTVKFSQPLDMPNAIVGGDGWTEPFTLEFVEQPGIPPTGGDVPMYELVITPL